jgi:hypothetical protein
MNSTLRLVAALLVAALVSQPAVWGQTRRRTPARPVPPRTEPAKITCPNVLGEGVQTMRSFCDVSIELADPAKGILIPLPPHTGPVTLMFDLHNRHTYSEALAKSNLGYRRYTASIGVMALDNTLLSRAVVHSEFRTARDLFDRVGGGTGPGGVKAVAPTGMESIVISIGADETSVSIVGEKLTEERLGNSGTFTVETFTAPGRPVAVISNVMLEYRPGPAPRTPARRPTTPPARSGQPAKPPTRSGQ